MFSQTDRNPSPPPEILENDKDFVPDRIGNSMYSKRWLYKTLVKILKFVQNSANEDSVDKSLSEPAESSENEKNIIELDPKIEDDICTLWDMSANSEVSEFLCECDVADIFLTVMESTKSPRLLEIVVGILGNMLTFNSTYEYISKNKTLVNAIVMLSGCSDSCTLVQLFRVLSCGIAKESCQKEWFKAFEENASFMENLKSIFENNLRHDVLKGLLEFLERMLNHNSTYSAFWGKEPYALAVIESGKQLLKCSQYEDLDSFFSVLNTLCEHSPNLLVYAKHFEDLRPIFHDYFNKLGEEETLPQIARVDAISSAFAMYGNLLMSESIQPDHILFETSLFHSMLNISKLIKTLLLTNSSHKKKDSKHVNPTIVKTKETNGHALEEVVDEDVELWEIFLEAIVYSAKACFSHTNQEADHKILEEIIKCGASEEQDSKCS